MADIYCCGCGLIFDSEFAPCPRCQRCSLCGTKWPASAEKCPCCAYPTDAEAKAELVKRLDPTLPANRKAIRSLEIDWENSLLRLNFLGMLVQGLLLGVILGGLLVARDHVSLWLVYPLGGILLYSWNRAFFRLLRQGWFRWLLRSKS